MKLVINSTDFSTIGTALYYDNPKFMPSWIYNSEPPQGYTKGGTIDMPNDLGSAYGFKDIYFGVDEDRYYAFPTPELFSSSLNFRKADYKYSEVYYHGSKDKILERDFAEYDFSFLVDKYKFNDNLKIQFLDNASKDILGYKVNELSTIENILFPSLYSTRETANQRKYFGTAIIGTYTLFLFPVPRGVRKVELYEGTVLDLNEAGYNYDYRNLVYQDFDATKNYRRNDCAVYQEKLWKAKQNISAGDWNETKWTEIEYPKPILSIYLGPDYMWTSCDPNFYMSDPEIWDLGFRYLPNSKKHLKGMDEIESDKILWMVITDSGQLLDINLSYNSWASDKVNPERNKWKYSLRNDEYYATKNNMPLVKDKSGILLDGRSSTILSTETVDTHPLLTRKMKKFDLLYFDPTQTYNTGDRVRYLGKLWKALEDIEPGDWDETKWEVLEQAYSPYCAYRLGERVLFNGYLWESLMDLNLGNRPDCSKAWILADSTDNFFTSRVNVIVNPSGAGRVVPGGQVRVSEGMGSKRFSIYETLGYKLESDSTKVCSPEVGEYLDDVGISIDNVAVEGGSIDKKVVTVNEGWDKVIESGKLIFNFKETPSTITLQGVYNDTVLPYSSWLVNNERISLKMTPSGTVGNTVSIAPGNTLILSPIQPLVNNRFKKVISTYTDRYGVIKTKELELSGNTVMDNIDFSEATYTFYIEKNYMILDCSVGLENFELEDNRIEVAYGSTGTFRFYPRQELRQEDIRVTLNNTDTIIISPGGSISYSNPGKSLLGVCDSYQAVLVSSYYELRFTNLISSVDIKITYEI